MSLSLEVTKEILLLEGFLGVTFSEEQKDFISDFTKNTLSFSDPGTGKTFSLVAGILIAQKVHNIHPSRICTLSFTRAAVAEISARYADAKQKRYPGWVPSQTTYNNEVTFSTFNALCRKIVLDLIPDLTIREDKINYNDITYVKALFEAQGIIFDDRNARKAIKVIREMNARFAFDEDSVSQIKSVVQSKIPVDILMKVRMSMFQAGLLTKQCTSGELPLYALVALLKYPNIKEKYFGAYDVMIVDEFQDMSLLALNVLSLIAKNLVCIGDINQQIYSFNGACRTIVEFYKAKFPDMRECRLSQSYRCAQEIADYAYRIVAPNKMLKSPFIGNSDGGKITLKKRTEFDWEAYADTVKQDFSVRGNVALQDRLIMCRNNASLLPAVHELWKHGLSFRCTRFMTVMEVPVFDTMTDLLLAAWEDSNDVLVEKALRHFPEFRSIPWNETLAPIQAMRDNKCSIFKAPVNYRMSSTTTILTAMAMAKKKIDEHASASIVYNNVYTAYMNHIYNTEVWKHDATEQYYRSLVGPIIRDCTFQDLITNEHKKQELNQASIESGIGIRCYTIHTAKGLEASEVIILDADSGTFPNTKEVLEALKYDCTREAYDTVNNERNLLYVAVTRAKMKVDIIYNTAPTELLTGDLPPEIKEIDYYAYTLENPDADLKAFYGAIKEDY